MSLTSLVLHMIVSCIQYINTSFSHEHLFFFSTHLQHHTQFFEGFDNQIGAKRLVLATGTISVKEIRAMQRTIEEHVRQVKLSHTVDSAIVLTISCSHQNPLLPMATPIHITPAALNDVAFTFLEQYAQGKISDMVALTKIDVELAIVGIPFNQKEWLDLMEPIMMNPTEGLNSIKNAWQLVQVKTNPLLEDPTTWQLVLRWAANDSFSFTDFLAEMEGKFKDRYNFNEWRTVFDQVFEASRKGTTIEVVRAAMTEHGVLDCPSVHDLSLQPSSSGKVSRKSKGLLPPPKRPRLSKIAHQFLDTATQDNDDNESEDESDQDDKVDCCPKVTEIALSGHVTLNKCLEHIFHHYSHEGNVEGLNAHAYQSPVHKAKAGMDMDVGPIESRIYMIELPTKAHNPLEVQLSLPPSHTDLIKEIMWIPSEKMQSIMKPCNIPVCSWNDITYVLSIEDDSIETLIVPQSLPYYSGTYNPANGHSLFDIELVGEHDFEVTISTNDWGHAITYCSGREYHSGCYHIYFLKSQVKVACIDPSLVDHTLTSFLAQWWQDGDTGRICSGDDVGVLEISIHDFKLEFPAGASVKVIVGLNCGFQGMGNDQQLEVPGIFLASYISPTTYTSQAHDQVQHVPLANENCLQPGDLVHVISGPHKGLCGTLHYYSGHEILVTSSMIQQKGTDDLGDKGKSKAQEPKVTRGDGDGDEDSDLMQVSISMDDAIVIPPPTLQFSKERGYDVTVSNHVRVAHSPAVGVEGPVWTIDLTTGGLTVLSKDGLWHDVPISFCTKLQDYSLRDVERQVGHEVWIISGPSKGYRGMLRLVGRTTCKVVIHSGIMQLRHTAVVTESGMLLSGTPLDPTQMVAFIELC
ncbi:hypothetical protein F5141DRAFT_1065613 [Pisolithus sp. B1]|nr:hypothetical protein F5141DRAFT_1065613 [Pisolithus sp. B1]